MTVEVKITETNKAVECAEKAIQKILLDLADELGAGIDHVEVDTRHFGACRTSIFIEY